MLKGQGRFLVPVLNLNVFRQIGKVNEPTSQFSRRAGSVSFRSFGFSSDCASWLVPIFPLRKSLPLAGKVKPPLGTHRSPFGASGRCPPRRWIVTDGAGQPPEGSTA